MYILIAALLGIGALVVWTVVFNARGREYEREVVRERGRQSPTDFGGLFASDTERLFAEKLFSYLQMETFTRDFAFRADDELWNPPLRFDRDDLAEDLGEFWDDLDLIVDTDTVGAILASATVGDLVRGIARVYCDQHKSAQI
jgi:hypothetical protein